MVRRNSSMPAVEIGLPDTARTKKSPRRRQGEESVAIIINPLQGLFKILGLLAHPPSSLPLWVRLLFSCSHQSSYLKSLIRNVKVRNRGSPCLHTVRRLFSGHWRRDDSSRARGEQHDAVSFTALIQTNRNVFAKSPEATVRGD